MKNNNSRSFLLSLLLRTACCLVVLGWAYPAAGQNQVSISLVVQAAPAAPGIAVGFPEVGKIKPRSAREIASSPWAVGGETLDRGFADYHQYKPYLGPLGVKMIRLQGGWAKTEKQKGQYDWAWLDSIIDDVVAQGIEPWLQTSYGNSIYEGGGGTGLSAGLPKSEEALAAWDNWVRAMVRRYQNKVKVWEVWNEPNFGGPDRNKDYIYPEEYARFFIRTAQLIRQEQPGAIIFAIALGHMELDYIDRFLAFVQAQGKLSLINEITYHDYVYNPDSHYPEVEKIKAIVQKYSPTITIRQGENGAPSVKGGFGAITDHSWSEVSQAKWNLRRMLGDLGHDIPSTVFSIIDMSYPDRMNNKGIIKGRPDKTVDRPKMAYHAVQHVTAVFDHSLRRIPAYGFAASAPGDTLAVFGYELAQTKQQVVSLWFTGSNPTNSYTPVSVDFSFPAGRFKQPVYVDLLTGNVYDIPKANWSRKGKTFHFKNIPVYDAPVLLAEKSLIPTYKTITK